MKKTVFIFILALMTASVVTAQPMAKSKFLDNWFVGGIAGAYVPSSTFKFCGNTEWQLGLRVGKWLTPNVGLAFEAQNYLGKNGHFAVSRTAINAYNFSALGLVNFSNLFGDYPGSPRPFEIIGVLGLGGAGLCGTSWKYIKEVYDDPHPNCLTTSIAVDFTMNFGSKKEWQAYIEPRMIYELANENKNVELNNSKALFGISIGVNYKFKTSNGTHNFKYVEIADPERLNILADSLNELSNTTDSQNRLLEEQEARIASLQKAIASYDSLTNILYQRNITITNLQPTVIFRQGRSTIDPAQFAPIEMIAKYMRNHPEARVAIKGYASPEGLEQLNQKLSEDRANVVRNALIKKYGIAPERLTAEGCGTTDKLFDEIEFNRVVTFNDDAKQ